MARIVVLSPIATVGRAAMAAPPMPREWAGRTVGFLDNAKPNFDRFSDRLGDLLRERHGVKDVVRRRKANSSTPAPVELLTRMAKECDIVLAGSAD